MAENIYSVSQVNNFIKKLIDDDPVLRNIQVVRSLLFYA